MLDVNDKIPMRWWSYRKNFGDLIGPWMVEQMTGKQVVWAQKNEAHYLTIGSVMEKVQPSTVAWGCGSFGTETKSNLQKGPKYLAVRGPLTRAKLEMHGIECPRIYGDPALLVPDYYLPDIKPKYRLGIIIRWSEANRRKELLDRGIKIIDLFTDKIEDIIDEILSCEKIISTSLHGLIIADAYGIPNSWLIADTGTGKEFKFWDYLISVNKERQPIECDITDPYYSVQRLLRDFSFDDRPARIDLNLLRSTCPFINPSKEVEIAESIARSFASPTVVKRDKPNGVLSRREKPSEQLEAEKHKEADAQLSEGGVGAMHSEPTGLRGVAAKLTAALTAADRP